jgi:hypothetical protein
MPDRDGIVDHIRHAEEWLRWARIDYRRGDVRSTVLRLFLAEAEIQHAREAGMNFRTVPPRRSRRVWPAVLGAAAVLVICAAGYTALRSAERAAVAVDSSPQAPVASVAQTPRPRVPFPLGTGRYVTLEPPLSGVEQGGSPGWFGTSEPRSAPGASPDNPAARSGHAAPAGSPGPGSAPPPGEPVSSSPTF